MFFKHRSRLKLRGGYNFMDLNENNAIKAQELVKG